MASSVDPDETARYEPSHHRLHCLHRYLFWSAGLKGLRYIKKKGAFRLMWKKKAPIRQQIPSKRKNLHMFGGMGVDTSPIDLIVK